MNINEDDNSIRSKASIHRVYLTAHNNTDRKIDVIWITYDGSLEPYDTIAPRNHINLNTFVTHPWVFVDQATGEQMRANGQTILYPLPLIVRNAENRLVYRRKRYDIHIPMRTLQMSALWTISSLLKSEKDIPKLELPNNLVIELERIFQIHKDHKERRDAHPDTDAVDGSVQEDDENEEWEDEADQDEDDENDGDEDDDESNDDSSNDDGFSDEEEVNEPAEGDVVIQDGVIPEPENEPNNPNRNNANHIIQ